MNPNRKRIPVNRMKRDAKATPEPMTCFECGKETLLPSRVSVDGERHGETFPVRVSGYRCTHCGFQTIDSQQSGEFTRTVSDAYRVAHGYLTSAEIRARRTLMGMTQQQFSEYLGTGIASVKRWEVGQIQDKAMDALIRLKTDPEAARENLRTLERQFPEPFIVFEGDDLSLAMTVGETQYVERSPMIVGTLSIPDEDRVDVDTCIAA